MGTKKLKFFKKRKAAPNGTAFALWRHFKFQFKGTFAKDADGVKLSVGGIVFHPAEVMAFQSGVIRVIPHDQLSALRVQLAVGTGISALDGIFTPDEVFQQLPDGDPGI